MRITKVTTKTGDSGKTKLGDGQKVSKSDLRIKCLGAIDELNSSIGFSKVATNDPDIKDSLLSIQNQLLNLGGEISSPSSELDLINNNSVESLEESLNQYNSRLDPLKEFIIPGDDEFSARIHIARSVCRRSETVLAELNEKETIKPEWMKFLNRLSDLLFVIARYHNKQSEIDEKQWDRT